MSMKFMLLQVRVYVELRRSLGLGLIEREKQILRLKKEGNLSDYQIARKLKVDAGNVSRSRKVALREIERAQADLDIALQVGIKNKVKSG